MFVSELRAAQLVLVEDLSAPVISDEDYRHLRNSLRLKDGAEINVSDGKGSWVKARLAQAPEVTSEIQSIEKPTETCVGFTPVKAERPEFVVQKLTELGIAKIVPLVCERSIVRWYGAKADKKIEKFQATARQACMQSRRVWLPQITAVTHVSDVVDNAVTGPVCVADPQGREVSQNDSCILIGPEGGFTDSERAVGENVSLPGGVLRAETAAVAAGVLLAK